MKHLFTKTLILFVLGLVAAVPAMAQVDKLNSDLYDEHGFLKLDDNNKFPAVDNLYVEKLLGHRHGQHLPCKCQDR